MGNKDLFENVCRALKENIFMKKNVFLSHLHIYIYKDIINKLNLNILRVLIIAISLPRLF